MGKIKVFMIMPFQDEFFEVFEMLKRQFESEFEFSHAGAEDNQQNILKDIIQAIYDTDIVIADLTGLNPNVFYELGVAHTLNKKVIMITKNINELPFDLKQYRAKEYSTHFVKFAELLESLNKYLHGAITEEIVYSNPVIDFLETKGAKDLNMIINKNNTAIAIPDNIEKGYLDFIADIEESIETLTVYINDMTNDMAVMSSGVEKSTKEIERVNSNGGSGTAAFVRKEAKKVANLISAFGVKLREHNHNYTQLWDGIEKNSLGLLENKVANQQEISEGLIIYLKSLKGMQNIIIKTNSSVEDFRTSICNNVGMERTLTQAIKFVEQDLNTYLGIMVQITASIDRIIDKSKFVVGEIDFSNIEEDSTNE